MLNDTAPPSFQPRLAPPVVFLAALGFALLLRLVLMQLLLRNGFVLSTMDEAIRWDLAWLWRSDPYWFTHWDGVWLTGHQFYWGALSTLIPRPLIAIQTGVILNHILSLAAIGGFAWTLARCVSAGVVAMLLTAAGFPFLWMGHGPLVEPLLVACLGLAGLAAIHLLRQPPAATARRWAWAALTAFALFLVTTLHYIGWMSIACAFPFVLTAAVLQFRAAARASSAAYSPEFVLRYWLPWLLIGLAAIAFPLLWVYGSWHYLGHPLQFLRNQDASSIAAYEVRGLTTRTALLMLPTELFRQVWPLLALPLLLAFRSIRARLGPAFWAVVGFTLLLSAFQLVSSLRGGFSISAYRNVIVQYVVALALSGCLLGPAVAGALPRLRAGLPRLALGLALLAAASGWTGYNLLIANRAERYLTEEMPHDIVAMAELLRQEYRRPQMLPVYDQATRIGVAAPHYAPEWTMWFAYATGAPDRFEPLPVAPGDPTALESYSGHYLLLHALPAPAGWQPFLTVGSWSLLHRAGS